MTKQDPNIAKKEENRRTKKWIIKIFITTIFISGFITFFSDEIMEDSSLLVAFIILFLIVLIGIIFDVIGVAVTAADERPFHSMAARKIAGAQECIALLRNAERVSSVCNDVIGDICGVVSGSASATIAAEIILNFDQNWHTIVPLLMSSLVAALTVGGKAIGKGFAVNSSTSIVYLAGQVIYAVHHVKDLFRKKKKD